MDEKKPYSADDFLRSVREARIEKRRCELRLEELHAQCEKVTASYGPLAPGGSGDDHRDGLLAAAAEQADELTRRRAYYVRRQGLVEQFITRVPEPKYRVILRLRYVDLLRWDGVLSGMQEYGLHYSERAMYKLHGEALAEARRRFPAWVARHPEVIPKDEEDETA